MPCTLNALTTHKIRTDMVEVGRFTHTELLVSVKSSRKAIKIPCTICGHFLETEYLNLNNTEWNGGGDDRCGSGLLGATSSQ